MYTYTVHAETHTPAQLLNKLADILHKIETVPYELSCAHETNTVVLRVRNSKLQHFSHFCTLE
jgi:hypothetical protein